MSREIPPATSLATLHPVSKRFDWRGEFELIDDETGDVITDLTDVGVAIEVRNRQNSEVLLCATTANGKVVDVGGGILEWIFPRLDMTGVLPGSYELGATISRGATTDRISIGIIPLVEGIVAT